MLLGQLIPTFTTALEALNDAQDDYDTKYAEINDATYNDGADVGFHAYLMAEMVKESLNLNA